MGDSTQKADRLKELIQFLSQSESYPHKPEYVKHIQTHISHVFLASPYVYKFKKPVDFGFLDYSTLSKREKFCRREVELNRRLSDDVYLGVVAIIRRDGGFAFLENGSDDSEVVEYGVKMKQLPEEYFLHSYLENDSLTLSQLDRVADKLADFYNSQSPDEDILKWGKTESIKVNTDENFSQTESFIGKTINRNAYEVIKKFTNLYFEKYHPLFKHRIKDKRIVDGHGDLHLEHIHITPEKVRIYDCIEFNERFRYGDVAVDVAFLAMDLDFNNRWKESQYFIDQLSQKMNDPDLLNLIDFYKCYRAYVKGKVKSLQSTEEEVPKEERDRAVQLASRYFNLSLRYALLGSQPTAIVFMGKVGTGKSTLARHLHEKLEMTYFSSDHIRKSLAGLPLKERTPVSKRDELYSSEMSVATYKTLFDKAVSCLEAGKSVILDATFSDRRSRKRLIDRLEALAEQLVFVEARAPAEVLKKRLKARDTQKGVISDARLEDFEKLSRGYDSPEEFDKKQLITVNTDQAPEETIKELYLKLADWNVENLLIDQ